MFKETPNQAPGEAQQETPLTLKQKTLNLLIEKQRELQMEIDTDFKASKENFGVTPEEHAARLRAIQDKMVRYETGQKLKMKLMEEIRGFEADVKKVEAIRTASLNQRFEPATSSEDIDPANTIDDTRLGAAQERSEERVKNLEIQH
jgi:hypothetical protein